MSAVEILDMRKVEGLMTESEVAGCDGKTGRRDIVRFQSEKGCSDK